MRRPARIPTERLDRSAIRERHLKSDVLACHINRWNCHRRQPETAEPDRTHNYDGPSPSIDERFEDFHATHPWVLEALEDLTTRWVEAGGGRIGVNASLEQLRWLQ